MGNKKRPAGRGQPSAGEIRLRDAAEAARLAGDYAAYWRLRRTLLMVQAARVLAERVAAGEVP